MDGRFSDAPVQLPSGLVGPVAIDFDNDGDHDLLAYDPATKSTLLFRNDLTQLSFTTSFDIAGALGSAADLDGDGFDDDVLLGGFPSPTMLLGGGAELSVGGTLPEPNRGPGLEYGLGAPIVVDLDGDGFVEIIMQLADNMGRSGARIWWGLPNLEFEAPRDQLWSEGAVVSLVGFADLDGVAPLELVVRGPEGLSYARRDLGARLPFACGGPLLGGAFAVDPAIGDIDGDGRSELAVRRAGEVELYGP